MTSQGRILVMEDDEVFTSLIKHGLKNLELEMDVVDNIQDVYPLLAKNRYSLLLVDMFLGKYNMLKEIKNLRRLCTDVPIIVTSAFGSIQSAVEAMNSGANYFVAKDEGYTSIVEKIERYAYHYSQAPNPKEIPFDSLGMIGDSPEINKIKETISTVKDINIPVLIEGESGTGKEVVARIIHKASIRRDKPFRAINCAAIPETLLESELFGHVKGAFTDAKVDKKGVFEICSEGSLLLDEIGDMPLHLQVKLLRVLEEKEITPLGTSTPKKISTYVMAATNKNLINEVRGGRFREDLFYRLNVITLHVPSLRERSTDIEMLIKYFLKRATLKYSKQFELVQHEMDILKAYSWPGNVRELKNIIERAVILTVSPKSRMNFFNDFTLSQNCSSTADKNPSHLPYTEAKNMFERNYMEHLLKSSAGNITLAAKIAKRCRGDIYRLIQKHNIEKPWGNSNNTNTQ